LEWGGRREEEERAREREISMARRIWGTWMKIEAL
jgi:hypothetical protein